MLKQLEGLSDVEAADRFVYDARWRHACGVGGWDASLVEFDRTVLIKFRMRLDNSDDPRRIFKVTTQVAAEAGLVGVKRVLDSAPLFDAVVRDPGPGHGHVDPVCDSGAAQGRRCAA